MKKEKRTKKNIKKMENIIFHVAVIQFKKCKNINGRQETSADKLVVS